MLAIGINKSRLQNSYYNWWEDNAVPSIHAEAAAIRRCKGDLTNAILYVCRVNNKGEEKMSKPCDNCQRLIEAAGIRKIVYTS